jgi:hypothetical protein
MKKSILHKELFTARDTNTNEYLEALTLNEQTLHKEVVGLARVGAAIAKPAGKYAWQGLKWTGTKIGQLGKWATWGGPKRKLATTLAGTIAADKATDHQASKAVLNQLDNKGEELLNKFLDKITPDMDKDAWINLAMKMAVPSAVVAAAYFIGTSNDEEEYER